MSTFIASVPSFLFGESLRVSDYLRAHPPVFWSLVALVTLRVGWPMVRAGAFRRLKIPGVPRWPVVCVCRASHLIAAPRYLTAWRYFFVSRFSRLLTVISRYVVLALLVSLIPWEPIQKHVTAERQMALAGFIAGAWLFDRTRLHRMVGAFTVGTSTDILITARHVFILRFVAVLVPWLRIHRRAPELGLSVTLEAHEQAPEERQLAAGDRPVFSDAWIVLLRLGQEPVRVATVFGKLDAERLVAGFAAVREQLEQRRGLFKREITHGAFAPPAMRAE